MTSLACRTPKLRIWSYSVQNFSKSRSCMTKLKSILRRNQPRHQRFDLFLLINIIIFLTLVQTTLMSLFEVMLVSSLNCNFLVVFKSVILIWHQMILFAIIISRKTKYLSLKIFERFYGFDCFIKNLLKQDSVTTPSASRRGKTSSLPSAQPWIKNRNYVPKPVRQVSSQ